jgi:hypothetical protein
MTFAPSKIRPGDAFSDFRVADLEPHIHVVADINEDLVRAFSVLHAHRPRNSTPPSLKTGKQLELTWTRFEGGLRRKRLGLGRTCSKVIAPSSDHVRRHDARKKSKICSDTPRSQPIRDF